VKVLDIDRERQRISLGLKQTQEDPWRRVLDEYRPGDVLEGKVTKVVAFGAFVEIIPGVEGLVHISELAEHHVENPSEVVSPGDETWVRILEIDENRRRISLSVKRAQPQNLPLRDLMPQELTGEAQATPDEVPDLDVSEEVFPEPPPQAETEQEGAADEEAGEPAAEDEAGEPPSEEDAGEPPSEEDAGEPPSEDEGS
jgi:small subunit ribosomal protein S1